MTCIINIKKVFLVLSLFVSMLLNLFNSRNPKRARELTEEPLYPTLQHKFYVWQFWDVASKRLTADAIIFRSKHI
jgi:hypothetical protein